MTTRATLSKWAVPTVLLAAAVMRVYGAWCHQHTTNVDFAITALMARQMAMGLGFPVFFYGQAMMGSLESVPGALFCRIFGCSGFWVCMGTVLFGIVLSPVIYLWARQAGGKTAGVAAAAYVIIGPPSFFVHMARTQYYAAPMLLGTLLVWLAVREIAAWRVGRSLRGGSLFAWGVVAGLGWWASQVVLYAVLTSAALCLIFMGRHVFQRRLLITIPGALLGGAPWWIWNLTNGFRSFGLGSALQPSGFSRGWNALAERALPVTLGLAGRSPGFRVLTLAAVGVGLVSGFVALGFAVAGRRLPENRTRLPAMAAVPLFLVVTVAVFCATSFGQTGAARYLLPAVPVLAVGLGIGTAGLMKRIGGWGALPLAILIALQLPVLPTNLQTARSNRQRRQTAVTLGDALREAGADAVYAGIYDRWMNFALKEEFCFWSVVGSLRHEPHWRRIEESARPAVLNNAGNIRDFLESAGGTAQERTVGSAHLYYGFARPADGLREIPGRNWIAMYRSGDRTAEGLLGDRRFDTAHAWDRTADEELRLVLDPPQPVSRMRLVFQDRELPGDWQAWGRRAPEDDWHALTGVRRATAYYWSGPRPYWRGVFRRQDLQLPGEEVREIRLVFPAARQPGIVRLTEIYLFRPDSPPRAEEEALDDLWPLVASSGVTRIYCDRWVGHQLRVRGDPAVDVIGEPYIEDRRTDPFDPRIRFEPGTALLVRAEDAPGVREVLNALGIVMREQEIAPWIWFDFGGGSWREAWREIRAARWTGFGCLLE